MKVAKVCSRHEIPPWEAMTWTLKSKSSCNLFNAMEMGRTVSNRLTQNLRSLTQMLSRTARNSEKVKTFTRFDVQARQAVSTSICLTRQDDRASATDLVSLKGVNASEILSDDCVLRRQRSSKRIGWTLRLMV
jgi:hypothetical protein